jgi:hypothetical protein
MAIARVLLVVLVGMMLGDVAPAAAQATRTWVSGDGNDVNDCSRTEPCKTFAGAISKTQTGGEISVLDPAGYGAVTITKSITIDGTGTYASILASGSNGIIVNAPNTARVTIRNVSINGARDAGSPGLNGIRYIGGGELHVENVVIENFSALGISAEGGAGNLHVADTVIRNVLGAGIRTTPAGGQPRITVERSRLVEVGIGVRVEGPQVAVVHDTSVTGSTGPGFWAENAAELHLDDVVVAHATVAVQASNGAVVSTAGLTAVGNSTGAFLAETGGAIIPFTGELIAGNPPGGVACELNGTSPSVACLGGELTCPAPVCPAPSCPAPVVEAALGNCKKCKTKGTKMVCTGCGIDVAAQ